MKTLNLSPVLPSETAVRRRKKQGGFTLLEAIIALVIGALVVGGALALSTSASTSQASGQLIRDLTSLRSATKALYFGQGSYGTASLNSVLINGNRVPSTMSVSGTTISSGVNSGAVTVTGATANYTISVTLVPTDVCLSVITGAQGFNSITVGANAAITSFPITPTAASTACALANPQTIVFQAT